MKTPQKIVLSGADKFILALEHHDTHEGTSGNTCRYLLELDGHLTLERLQQHIHANELANWLSSFELDGINQQRWKSGDHRTVPVHELQSNEQLPREILRKKQRRTDAPLFYFHLLQRSTGKSAILLSWHHLLMDGYGATLFLSNFNVPTAIQEITTERSRLNWTSFWQMRKAKRYITNSSGGQIQQIEAPNPSELQQVTRVLEFTEVETQTIALNARNAGAKFGQGVFLLHAVALGVQRLFNHLEHDYWAPVPQDTRKKGSRWPVVGNHLSFLFYRIQGNKLQNKKQSVQSLNEQLMHQAKNQLPQSYGMLMNQLRWIPSGIYAKLIRGTRRKNTASFLFTSAPDHPTELQQFLELPVSDALNVPPNSYPPGMTFVANRFEGKLKIIVLSYEHVVSEQQLSELTTILRSELLD